MKRKKCWYMNLGGLARIAKAHAALAVSGQSPLDAAISQHLAGHFARERAWSLIRSGQR